jgi:hypothetical protein
MENEKSRDVFWNVLTSFEVTYKICVLKSVLGCNLTWCYLDIQIHKIHNGILVNFDEKELD